jgi:uncharacterized protein with HEPN domain
MSRNNPARLADILSSIEWIISHKDKWLHSKGDDWYTIYFAILYHFEVIGEASSKLDDSVRELAPEIPWVAIISFRNFAIHEYHNLDKNEVKNTVLNDLELLKNQIENLLVLLSNKE